MGVIKSEIVDAIERCYREDYHSVYPGDFNKLAKEAISEIRIQEQMSLLSESIGKTLDDKRILEIGSGFGAFVALANSRYSIETYGLEPDKRIYGISLQVLESYGVDKTQVKNSPGEEIPFEKESFDIVVSLNTLEHVQDPKKVLSESIRVLKKNGYFHLVVQNFGSFWESHYGVFWIPYLPKSLASIYLSLLGRDVGFLKSLQFINQRSLLKIIENMRDVEVLDWGVKTWERRLMSLEFSAWAELGRLKKVVELAHRLRIIDLIRFAGRIFKLHTPIILTAKKVA